MKFQKMIRVQLMLVGLGAGLLLAKPVFAQQDVDPNLFEDTSAASQQDQAGFNVPAALLAATNVTEDTASSLAGQETGAGGFAALDVNSIFGLNVGVGSTLVLGIAGSVRRKRRAPLARGASS